MAEVDEDPEAPHDPSIQPIMAASPTRGPAVAGSITRDLSSQSTVTTQTNRSARTNNSARSDASDASVKNPMATNENKDPSSPRLDLNTARVSLFMELTAYAMMATAKTGTLFTAYTVLGSLAAGFTPAVQSLALGIYAGRGGEETGKLFGGLSVVQALGYTLLSSVLGVFTHSVLQWLDPLSDAFRVHVLQDSCDLPSGDVRRWGFGHCTRPSVHPLCEASQGWDR